MKIVQEPRVIGLALLCCVLVLALAYTHNFYMGELEKCVNHELEVVCGGDINYNFSFNGSALPLVDDGVYRGEYG